MSITVKQYGACGKGNSIDTIAFQSAIDQASKTDDEVIIEKGIYIIGTLFLRDNVSIKLEEGVFVFGSAEFEDYSSNVNIFTDAVGHERGRSLIYAYGVKNIKIYGKGTIDGRGELFPEDHPKHMERPFLIRLIDCKNVSIEGVTLQKSAAWCLHLMNCENVSVKEIKINSRVNGNNDGIDIDSCRRCIIENCYIDTGDDGICLKSTVDRPCSDIMVKGCIITSNWAGFKIGTESVGDYENIEFKDSFIYDCDGCAIKFCPVDGANINNVNVNNITIFNSTGPIFIANGYRLRSYQPGMQRNISGTINNVIIENIKGDCINTKGTIYKGEPWGNAKGCICISGTEKQKLGNITLRNIEIKMPGDVIHYENSPVPEMGTRYPEFHNFGILPAWGVYLRHIENIKLDGVKLSLKNNDVRKEIYYDDVDNCTN